MVWRKWKVEGVCPRNLTTREVVRSHRQSSLIGVYSSGLSESSSYTSASTPVFPFLTLLLCISLPGTVAYAGKAAKGEGASTKRRSNTSSRRESVNTNRNIIPPRTIPEEDDDAYSGPLNPLLPKTIRTKESRNSKQLLPDPRENGRHQNSFDQYHSARRRRSSASSSTSSSCGSDNKINKERLRRNKQSKHHPVPVVLISDPGQDLDDEMMFIMARHLVSLDLISLQGVIANLSPSFARARLTRGTLDLLGLHRVPVGIGTDGGDLQGKHSSDQFESTASSYIVQEDGEAARGLESGHRLLQRLYEETKDIEYVDVNDEKNDEEESEDDVLDRIKNEVQVRQKKSEPSTKVMRGGLVLVITSSTKDAAIFIRDNPTLFASKTREVVIMGGCKPVSSDAILVEAMAAKSVDSRVIEKGSANVWSQLAKIECQPDSAHNNTFDTNASNFFYSQCQKMNVTLTVVSRFAAYACKMPRSVYDDLALTGSSIGWRLRNSQRASIDQLWKRACSDDPAVRKGLPPRCNRKWFIDTFCGGDDDESRCCDDTAWDLVTGFMQYDTIALLAAIPGVRERYFDPFVLPPLEKQKAPCVSVKGGTPRVNSQFSINEKDEAGSKDEDETIVAEKSTDRKSENWNGENRVDRRSLMARSSSDPGPLFIARAIARANEDNDKIEDAKKTLLAMEPPGASEPEAFGRGTRNLIGVCEKDHNLKDPMLLVELLKTGYRSGILCNHHTQPHIILHLQLRWDNLADTLLTCLMLRSMYDMRLASVLGVIVSINPSDVDREKQTTQASANGDATTHNGETLNSDNGTSPTTLDESPSTLSGLAESIRDTLSLIGLSHVKFLIVAGADMNEHKQKSSDALLELYESAPPIGVTLVLTATFTSVWPFAEAHPDLFRNKTVRVVHTGGALVWPAKWGWAKRPISCANGEREASNSDLNMAELTEEKILVPDPAAQNHRLDLLSARGFYNTAQSLSVPLVILSRHVARECCIPREFFDVLGSVSSNRCEY